MTFNALKNKIPSIHYDVLLDYVVNQCNLITCNEEHQKYFYVYVYGYDEDYGMNKYCKTLVLQKDEKIYVDVYDSNVYYQVGYLHKDEKKGKSHHYIKICYLGIRENDKDFKHDDERDEVYFTYKTVDKKATYSYYHDHKNKAEEIIHQIHKNISYIKLTSSLAIKEEKNTGRNKV